MRSSIIYLKKDSRKYLFTTRKNIRDYEWSIEDADQLLEDIMSTDANNSLELGPITVMKDTSLTKKEQMNIGKTSQMYDVHDGQQRSDSMLAIGCHKR